MDRMTWAVYFFGRRFLVVVEARHGVPLLGGNILTSGTGTSKLAVMGQVDPVRRRHLQLYWV